MKKTYIKPATFSVQLANENLLEQHSEPEGGSWVGAKENNGFDFSDDDPFGDLWDDEPGDDPFSTGN